MEDYCDWRTASPTTLAMLVAKSTARLATDCAMPPNRPLSHAGRSEFPLLLSSAGLLFKSPRGPRGIIELRDRRRSIVMTRRVAATPARSTTAIGIVIFLGALRTRAAAVTSPIIAKMTFETNSVADEVGATIASDFTL